MTSVVVISSAVARINCLKDLLPKQSLLEETDELLKSLKGIKESLEADDGVNVEAEKEIVRLSYDIVDAMADASSPSKETIYGKLPNILKTSNVNSGLEPLQKKLIHFHAELKGKKLECTTGSASSKEKQQTTGEKLINKLNLFGGKKSKVPGDRIERQKSKGKFAVGAESTPEEGKVESKVPADSVERQKSKGKSVGAQSTPEEGKVGTDAEMLPKIKESLSKSTVVYIVGESGIGKSAVATKLFEDLQVGLPKFDVCARVPIKRNVQIKRVFEALLKNLDPSQGLVDMRDMTETELITNIFAALKDKTYLLLLDHVNSPDDWESIRLALPIAGNTKVIITSSCKGDFTPSSDVYGISSMSLPSIRDVLEKESFRPGLENVEEAIFHASGGSLLLATILAKSVQSEATIERQQQLVNELKSYESSAEGKSEVLAVCYKWLAPEMKPCLLYLSQFRRGLGIEVEKLYLLLLAENLIFSPKGSELSLVEALTYYLEELARRKLVKVQEDIGSRTGNHKTYRLQFQVQNFCKLKASEEEFLQIVDMSSPEKIGLHARRLSIHLSKKRVNKPFIQFESQDTLKKILSLLIFDTRESAEEKSELPKEINDLKEFTRLRILKFDGVNFGVHNVVTGIEKLVLLRYLSFRGCWLGELPSSVAMLTQLETLDLVVQDGCEMVIPNNILANMKRMVHLYFPKLYKRSENKTKIQLQSLLSLEILVNFDMEACDVGELSKFNELRILSTVSNGDPNDLTAVVNFINEREQPLEYSSVNIRSFNCYDNKRVSALEKLLACQLVHSIHIKGRIGELPKEDKGTNKVADIELDGSEILADPMEYLGMFQNLESLVLKNDAFVASKMTIAAAPLFRNLRSLKLENLQYMKKLTIAEGAMPQLSTLKIDSCNSLRELSIPKGLDDRLKKAPGVYGDAYSIMPMPKVFHTTP